MHEEGPGWHPDGADLPWWALTIMLAVFMVGPTTLAVYVIATCP